MKKHNLVYIMILSSILILLLVITHISAEEVSIQGKVVLVNGQRVKIEYEGQYMPNTGDKVEIGFKIGDDFILVEGEWKIVEVTPEFAQAQAEGPGAGTPAVGYLAIINSGNLSIRSDSAVEKGIEMPDKISNAVSDGKTESPDKIAKEKTPATEESIAETVEGILASFTRTSVKKDFAAPGSSISCESGKIRTGADSIEMVASGGVKNDFCTFKISGEPLDNFYAAVNVSVNTASHYDYMAGIIYGDVIESRIKPDSIIAVASLMSGKGSGGGLFKSRIAFLARVGAYRRTNEGKSHTMIVEKILSNVQSNRTPGILEFLKTAKKCRIFWNGQEMGSWEEPIISRGNIFLAFTPVVKGKTTATFRDIKLYRLH